MDASVLVPPAALPLVTHDDRTGIDGPRARMCWEDIHIERNRSLLGTVYVCGAVLWREAYGLSSAPQSIPATGDCRRDGYGRLLVANCAKCIAGATLATAELSP